MNSRGLKRLDLKSLGTRSGVLLWAKAFRSVRSGDQSWNSSKNVLGQISSANPRTFAAMIHEATTRPVENSFLPATKKTAITLLGFLGSSRSNPASFWPTKTGTCLSSNGSHGSSNLIRVEPPHRRSSHLHAFRAPPLYFWAYNHESGVRILENGRKRLELDNHLSHSWFGHRSSHSLHGLVPMMIAVERRSHTTLLTV